MCLWAFTAELEAVACPPKTSLKRSAISLSPLSVEWLFSMEKSRGNLSLALSVASSLSIHAWHGTDHRDQHP